MGSAAENRIAQLCTNPRLALDSTPYIHLPGELQLTMLEWMQQEASGFPNVMSNAVLIGRRPFIFATDGLKLTNEKYLHDQFEEPAVAIAMAKELMELVGVVDQPLAMRFQVRRATEVRAHFVILPVMVCGREFQILRVAGW
ncbi:MAG: hypothetical protein HQ481_10945 [Alphaproteobacteria bacterium]|nr:hypothetical protein [Alphaproteobacteria bacterium]